MVFYLVPHLTISDLIHELRPMTDQESAALEVLGDHAKTRILLVLLTDPGRDYNKTDIAKLANIGRTTVYRHMDDLVECGLLNQTRKAGNSPMYQLDRENGAVKALAQFEREAAKSLDESRDGEDIEP